MIKIYFDMDGVLTDFDKKNEEVNYHHPMEYKLQFTKPLEVSKYDKMS